MISAVVLTKNEEKNIIDCVENLSWCSEIIVVDDYSEDRTLKVLESLKNQKIKTHKRKLADDFAAQRNFGLEKAIGEWVLYVDADERVSEKLVQEIQNKIKDESASAFYIRRIDNVWGKLLLHGETGNAKFIRLAKKDAGKWNGKVHEKWIVKGSVVGLASPIIHYPIKDLSDFLRKINFYTDLRAQELKEKGVRVSWVSIIAYPKGKFILNYFLRRGFLDGTNGFVHAILMSFHSFLVRGKLWLLWQQNEK